MKTIQPNIVVHGLVTPFIAQLIHTPPRIWSWNGRSYEGKIEAKCIASKELKARGVQDEAQILMVDGSRLWIRLSELSPEDQKFIEKWSAQEQTAQMILHKRARNHEVYYNTGVLVIFCALILVIWTKRKTFNTQKLKAVYVSWLFMHLMLLIFSSDPFNWGDSLSVFYPFIPAIDHNLESGIFFDHTEVYDITEFLVYSMFPFVVWYTARLWCTATSITKTDKI